MHVDRLLLQKQGASIWFQFVVLALKSLAILF